MADYVGVYVATPPLKQKNPGLSDAIYRSNADGVYVRLMWEQVEPKPGVYDWTKLDNEASRAIASGKKISIAVRAGDSSPDWLYSRGVGRVEAVIGPHGGRGGRCWKASFPRPWDPAYQAAYGAMISAMAAHLKRTGAYQSVGIVKITGINQSSEETRLPSASEVGVRGEQKLDQPRAADAPRRREPCELSDAVASWQAAGYRPSRVVGAWRELAASVNRAFPDKLLAIAILNGNDFPLIDEAGNRSGRAAREINVKEEIIAAGVRMFPGRFAVQWNGLNMENSKPALESAQRAGALLGYQTNLRGGNTDGSRCVQSKASAREKCTPQTYDQILQNGVQQGARYLEVWPVDALEFPQAISRASAGLRDSTG